MNKKAALKVVKWGLLGFGLFVAEALVQSKMEDAAGEYMFEERFNKLYDKKQQERRKICKKD